MNDNEKEEYYYIDSYFDFITNKTKYVVIYVLKGIKIFTVPDFDTVEDAEKEKKELENGKL